MRVKQGAIFAIAGCVLWVVVQAVSILGSIAAIINTQFDTLAIQVMATNIIQNFGGVIIATSFLIFFIYIYMGKQSRRVSLIALIGSIIWIILNISAIVSNYLEHLTLSSMPYLAYAVFIASLLMILVSIIFLILFILNYSNYNKENTNSYTQTTAILGITGSAVWLIAYTLILVQNFMIYTEYNIPMITLFFGFSSWVAPIGILIYFSTQLLAITKR